MSTLAINPGSAAESPFDAIKQTRPDGSEFWSARDLCQAVKYETWRNFAAAIDRAKIAAGNSGSDVTSDFVGVDKMVALGVGAQRNVEDYELSRFAAYLVVMNGDPRKPAIASAQAYFAIRTRQAEVVESTVMSALEAGKAQLELMQLAQGLIDPKHLEVKARLVLARAMGEAPELDPSSRPLYAQTYLEERGKTRSEVRSMSSAFGKRVKAAYIFEHGEEPKQYPLETSTGQVRMANAYTEGDRPLFDAVWAKFYDTDGAA